MPSLPVKLAIGAALLVAVGIAAYAFTGAASASSPSSTPGPAPAPGKQADWTCIGSDGAAKGNVKINWGYTPADAAWACKQWVSDCGKSPGGCTAVPQK